MIICLGLGEDLHMSQLMPLPLTISCFSKIQIGFTFLVPAHTGSLDKGPLNVCACVCTSWRDEKHQLCNENNENIIPVPPAIMPTLFTFRIAGADFLSGRMANSPEYERKNTQYDTIQQQQQPFNGRLSGTTRVGRYQKKHSPAHTHPGQHTSFITFLHLQQSTASSLFSLRA